MYKGSTTLELSRSHVLPRTQEDIPIITMEAILTMEQVHITRVALKNGNENGGNTSQNHFNPATPAKKDLSHIAYFKCGKTGHYALNVQKQRVVVATEDLEKSPTLSPEVR